MDKQKVFWVVLAVSVFVVVVLIVGVLLLRQHPGTAPRATVTPMNDSGTQVYEYTKPAPQATGTGPQAGTTPGGDQQTMHFYIGEGQPSGQTPGTTPAPGASPAAPGGPAPSATAPGQTPTTPAPAVSPVTPPASTAPAATAARPKVVKPAVAVRTPKKTAEYWIQAGSYKSQSKAEELVTMLEGKGLASRVFSYSSTNDTFYRVRVGPYTNRGEADKFLGLVKQVQGLETSFISMIPAKSTVN